MGRLAKQQRVIPHNEFIDRIRKSFYFGDKADDMNDDMLSRPLAEYASELFSEPHKGHSLNRLTTTEAGNVQATPCSLIMALIYMDRLNVLDPGFARLITPQELFIVSMMISTKFFAGHDEEIYLSDWAKDGNMSEDRLKQLELEFLSAIDWNIYISNEQFFNKLNAMERQLARREGLRRGWCTYSELMHLLPSLKLVKFLLNNITVMAVSYAASVMTIAGAFFLASQIPGNALHRKPTATRKISLADQMLLPGPPDDLHNVNVTQATHTVTVVDKNNATNGLDTTVTIINIESGSSCRALNVEAELRKLERQYLEEATLEDLRRRNNEIETESRLTLPAAAKQQDNLKRTPYQQDTQRNWLAIKEEYSDGKCFKRYRQHDYVLSSSDAMTRPLHSEMATLMTTTEFPRYGNCLDGFTNCTSFMFWQLLADAAHQSFVRLPLTWFKFI